MFKKMGAFELTLSIPPLDNPLINSQWVNPNSTYPKKEQALRAAPTMRWMLPGSLTAM